MQMLRAAIPFIVVLVVAVTRPFSAVAVSVSDNPAVSAVSVGPLLCGRCAHNLDTNEHWFHGNCDSGSDCYDCVAFNSCHSNPQTPFQCGVFHWLCGSAAAALAAVDNARDDPDAEMMLRVVAEASPEYVMVHAGGYVLVRGCNGALVAAYPLSTHRAEAVVASRSMADALQPVGPVRHRIKAYPLTTIWRAV